jgi:pre-mRNA-splicing factor 18
MSLREGDFEDLHDFVRAFYKGLVHKWQEELDQRTEDQVSTVSGRALTSSVAQLAAYVKPFFKLCKKRNLPRGMLAHVVNMVNMCLQREYVQAESAYFDLSIGRAAWPMGVTTTGIHNRAARTKLFVDNVAHVMNDEQQRKYITSIKRLMTECERWYATDPSKSTAVTGPAAAAAHT